MNGVRQSFTRTYYRLFFLKTVFHLSFHIDIKLYLGVLRYNLFEHVLRYLSVLKIISD